MLKDLRYGLRMLLHAKGWTAVVVLSLALGIGANTAIFSAMNAMLLTRIPVKDPDTLVRLRYVGRNQMATSSSDYGVARSAGGEDVRTTFSYPIYQQFLKDNQTMTDVLACAPDGRVNVAVNGQAELATAFVASGNYFRVLGVDASLGRVFGPDDDTPTAPPVAVISDRFWRSRFGSDRSVLGKVVSANLVQVTIVGVLPRAFTGIQQPVAVPADITFPVNLEPQINRPPVINGVAISRLVQPTYWWLQVMGRLKPGRISEQVEGNLAGVFQATARAGLDSYLAGLTDRGASRFVQPEPDRGAAIAGGAGRAWDLRRQRNQPARRAHPHRCRRARVADRLCQRGQPAVVAGNGPAERGVDPALGGGDAGSPGPANARRKSSPGISRRCARDRRRLLGKATAPGHVGNAGASRLARVSVHRLRRRPDRRRVWHRSGVCGRRGRISTAF